MKQAIQKLAHGLGVSIHRVSPGHHADPFEAMQHLLAGRDDLVIFDVGAHHGQTARHFRSLFPGATIYAFEPFPESFAHIEAHTTADPRIHAFPFGLGDRAGTQSFHANPNSATNSLLATDRSGADTWGGGLLETVEVVEASFNTLDAVLDEMQIPHIDILKLDVQGAEPLVMAGAAAACQRGAVSLVYSEIITQPTYQDQKRFDQALALFYDRGFDLYDIYNPSYTSEGRLRQVDVLLTKRGQ